MTAVIDRDYKEKDANEIEIGDYMKSGNKCPAVLPALAE